MTHLPFGLQPDPRLPPGEAGSYRGQSAASLIERIEASSIPEPNSGCWLWMGHVSQDGYGKMSIGPYRVLAHRVSFAAHKPSLFIEDLYVCHRCDMPGCVNPDHLFVGTQTDNMADMISKGRKRHSTKVGADRYQAMLTDEIVAEVRSYPRYAVDYPALMKKYGVTKTALKGARHGKSWKHVPSREELQNAE